MSNRYLQTFDYLDGFRKCKPFIDLNSPFEIPPLIARNHLQKNYSALRLAKTGVILNATAHIESVPPPITTLYLHGPDQFCEKEATEMCGYFMTFPQDWRTTEEYGQADERLGLNTTRKSDLFRQYKEILWIGEIASAIDRMTTEEIIRVAYDFALGRTQPTGLRKVVGLEAFSPLVVNTISRNFTRARANGFLKNTPVRHPRGRVVINEIKNDINLGEFSDERCLKIGPSNNLLTFHAIYFLNLTGWKADLRTLALLLACEYLRVEATLKNKRGQLTHVNSVNRRVGLEKGIAADSEKRDYLKKHAYAFVQKSISSLLEQGAIVETPNGLVALGNEISYLDNTIVLEADSYLILYRTVLQRILDTHKLTMLPRKELQPIVDYGKPHVKPIVYVASTCYDLRDTRAECARALREWGFRPYLNEDSDFPVTPGVNSYQACVEAVKKADYMVLIIGTRYGGEIQELGMSITELEYKTACAAQIPRINFCLDTVWSLIQVHKKNPYMNYPSLFNEEKAKVDKIFKFLDEVRKYELEKTDNWVFTFKNSIELKDILRNELKIFHPSI